MILRTSEDFLEYEKANRFISHNHIHIRSVSEDGAAVSAALQPESCNAGGFVHGGLMASLIDVAASQAAMADGRHYVTQNCFINFISNVESGQITALSTIVKRGRKTAVIHVQIRSDSQKLLADASVTMMCTDE